MRAGERGWIGLAPSPCPAPPPGRWKGCRGPVLAGFTRMLNQAGMCRGKQGNELLIAERPVQKAADQRRQRRPMPCCSSPLPSPVQKGRSSPGRRSATPLLASDRLCIDDALLVGECPHGRPPFPGALFPARFPFFCLHLLPSLCSKQSREARPYDFQCNAFCLKREQVEQEFVFLNTLFLSKET